MSVRPAHYNTRYKFDLSPRQREVLDLIARGRTNAENAGSLGVSLDGAKYHVREILAKLNVDSREEAASYWQAYNRPTARLARAFSGLFGLGMLKAVAGSAAIIAAGGAVAPIVVGINAARESDTGGDPVATTGADGTAAAAATPDATTTPAPETPAEFARRIATLVSASQLDELLALSEPVTFVCPGGTPKGAGGAFPLCDGAAPGEERRGYITTRDASEAETIARDAFLQQAAELLAPDLVLVSTGTTVSGDALVLGFTSTTGDAVFLPFETSAGAAPQLSGLGLTAAQATPIFQGGEAILFTGPTNFEPLE